MAARWHYDNAHLKFSMFLDVIGPHSVEDELGLVGHTYNVITGRMGQQSEMRRTRVLL